MVKRALVALALVEGLVDELQVDRADHQRAQYSDGPGPRPRVHQKSLSAS